MGQYAAVVAVQTIGMKVVSHRQIKVAVTIVISPNDIKRVTGLV
jgi:hypothetical protein